MRVGSGFLPFTPLREYDVHRDARGVCRCRALWRLVGKVSNATSPRPREAEGLWGLPPSAPGALKRPSGVEYVAGTNDWGRGDYFRFPLSMGLAVAHRWAACSEGSLVR
jgi:hypothetical protein